LPYRFPFLSQPFRFSLRQDLLVYLAEIQPTFFRQRYFKVNAYTIAEISPVSIAHGDRAATFDFLPAFCLAPPLPLFPPILSIATI
jgi:hypothetical protein